MTFISYAQNFEDVMLWRALCGIKVGFYIDVGAWSPDVDSVTRAFYERDWYGINVEPNPIWHRRLSEKRPRDINLLTALSDRVETLDLYIVGETGLSTANANYAREHEAIGHSIQSVPCPATTLEIIWEEYVEKQEVHFMKVDVEGMEQKVLRGNDWKKHRPWIILVESTYPNSMMSVYQAWESILLKADYDFVYADGLNRFYLASEHSELSSAFAYPPNYADDFKFAAHVEAEKEIANLKQQLSVLEMDRAERLEVIIRQEQRYAELHDKHTTALRLLEKIAQSHLYRFARRIFGWNQAE